jgi:hypothetical protein
MNIVKSFLSIGILFSSLILYTPTYAEKKPFMEADLTPVNVKIQNFPVIKPVNVTIQLRYVNEKIKYFAFHNKSDDLLKITMFQNAYELKPNQDLSISVPQVSHVVVEISQYDPDVINVTKQVPAANAYLFRVQSDGKFALYSTY